ncbi:hypothetical protein [Amycolatopsis sp. GM8]|uniref:hypothetical protein n=1 Tax=Amycolatopsis sp. GM8 TaxID=2896530 RepID=UPI001F3BD525|nr:hypothetical protein [Amycolatopsis sp. GM8]
MTETPFGVDPVQRRRLELLAGVVQSELVAAGLPVVPGESLAETAGAVVAVDMPYLRGVLVDWREHNLLLDAAQDAWGDDPHHEGEECAAFSRLTSAIGEAMAKAMQAILVAAGLEVARTDNDYAPHELLITRRLAQSPWRARRDARAEARSEKMGAAWNERSAANCPNPDCEVHGPIRDRDNTA